MTKDDPTTRPTGSSWTHFRRLLRYTKPYRVRLCVGLLAGAMAGGSLFGALRLSPTLIRSFIQGTIPGLTPVPGAIAVPGAPALDPVTSGVTPPSAPAADAAPLGVIVKPAKLKELGTFEKFARSLHITTSRADGTMTWQFLLLLVLGLPFFMLLRAAAIYLNHYCMRWVGARVVVDLRNDLFTRLVGQSLGYFGKIDVGHLISRCTYDTSLIEHTIAVAIADLAQAPMEIAAAVVFIVLAAAEYHLLHVVVVLFGVFAFCIVPIIILGRYVRRYTHRALERISELVSRMQEVFTGIRVVKAYHTEEQEIARFLQLAKNYFRTVIRTLRYELMMAPLMEVVAVACACGFLVYCYSMRIGFDIIIPVGGAAMMAYRPLKLLAKVNASLQRTAAACERIFNLLDTDTALRERPNPVRLHTFSDRVEFEHVDFNYDAGSLPVLHDVHFSLQRGTAIAFVGETGSGKTTVAGLLARFFDPVQGRVLIDGHDLRDIEIASLRRLVGILSQETILFNDTIASNIAYGTPGATPDEIVAAARKANAHEFIMAEPEGYERVVGEKGFRLSGGQRQRIAIARAVLKNPPILILDEATSALDSVTEQLVQEELFQLMQDRTVFVIAHRLGTVKHCACIYVIDKGRIVEHGTHADLYATAGVYRRLCDSQFAPEP